MTGFNQMMCISKLMINLIIRLGWLDNKKGYLHIPILYILTKNGFILIRVQHRLLKQGL